MSSFNYVLREEEVICLPRIVYRVASVFIPRPRVVVAREDWYLGKVNQLKQNDDNIVACEVKRLTSAKM